MTFTGRMPTDKQHAKLCALGVNYIVLAPRRGEWGPLLRRGWVEPIREDNPDKRYLPPLRLTPDGMRAIAAYIDKYGQPDWKGDKPEQLDESPGVTRLKEQLADEKAKRTEAEREAHWAKLKLRRIVREVEGVAL